MGLLHLLILSGFLVCCPFFAIAAPAANCKTLDDPKQIYHFDGTSKSTTRTTDDGRSYLLHLPSKYQQDQVHAVVLSFHGNGKDSDNQQRISQLSNEGQLINGKGIIAVYPQALPNKTGGSFSWQGAPYAADVDDIGFTQTILDEVTSNLCVDPTRIYASGKSNGGGFVNLLACTKKVSRIAAFALVSSALYPDTLVESDSCQTARTPTPILISHGTADGVIDYTGRKVKDGEDPKRYTPDIDSVADWWASVNNLTSDDFHPSQPYDDAELKAWPKTGSSLVLRYKIAELGHSWPTTEGLDTSGGEHSSASFDLTNPDLLKFFEDHPLPA